LSIDDVALDGGQVKVTCWHVGGALANVPASGPA
jgi:hypothetical protein